MLNSELTKNNYLSDEEIVAFFDTPRKSRKERRKNRNQASKTQIVTPLTLKEIKPLTNTQSEIFESFFNSDQNLFLHGYAGTGKSFISSYLLMSELEANPSLKKLKIVRSTVPSRDQGFLPGNAEEKAKIYEMPYHSIFADLYGRANSYDQLKRNGKVEFESTSYLRGTT
jgi:phosphate starvation-inducible PhoH-like protein